MPNVNDSECRRSVARTGDDMNCECWTNPDTGYLEECARHQALRLVENCDWCGDPFAAGERRFEGYEKHATHQKCLRDAIHAFNRDSGEGLAPVEREPFNDWPNGQGTYD